MLKNAGMQTKASRIWCLGCQLPRRCFSKREETLYDSLGVGVSATQNEIKAAYYKMSKMHHPDTNEGSKEAAEKFRIITEAYEVLGNVQRRRMYDRGVSFHQDVAPPETSEQAAVSKFYRARSQHQAGDSTVYDFDEWSRNHYGRTFARREKAKARYQAQVDKKTYNRDSGQSIGTTSFFIMISFIVVGYLLRGPSPDEVAFKRDKK